MSITLTESFAERIKAKAAEGLQTIETITNQFVADGKPYDIEVVIAAAKDANLSPKQVDELIELKQKIVNWTREVGNDEPEVDADLADATRERLELDKEEEDFKKAIDEKRRQNRHKWNVAQARKEKIREMKSFLVRHCKTPAFTEASNLSNSLIAESKKTASEIRSLELATAQEPRRTIAASGFVPGGGTATRDQIENAKAELAEIHAKLATLNRRYQLLQIQIPIAIENCARAAVNQAPLPLPIDYRRGTIGNVIPVYEGESSLDEVQAPSTGGSEPLTPGVSDTEAEARRIQAETASRAAGALPTRNKTKATESDLEI